ncbi:MAG TPA: DUF1059 domain-containing protein [Thermoplasmata archaeon]|nr:DUF1059 domain-containing protein [Thermoplasmata archaeon]
MAAVALACRDLGFACEWAVRSPSRAAADERLAEHLRCAHAVASPDDALRSRIEAAFRPA